MTMADNYAGPWSEWKRTAIAIGPHITAPFSIVGSITIVYVLLFDKHESKNTPFRRLMFMLCVNDIISSLGFSALYGWRVPTEPYNFGPKWATGTTATCELQGFVTNFFQGAMCYTASLSIYYVLLVRYKWSQRQVRKYAEPWMHALSISWPLITGAYSLVKGFYNPVEGYVGWCWVHDFPPDCIDDLEVECIRGGNSKIFRTIVGPLVILSTWLIILTCMLLMYTAVRETEAKLRKYGLGKNSETLKVTRQVGNQGLLYVVGYMLCFTCMVFINFYDVVGISPGRHPKWALALNFVGAYTLPLQGFVNFLVFFRTRWTFLLEEGRALHSISVHFSKSAETAERDMRSDVAFRMEQNQQDGNNECLGPTDEDDSFREEDPIPL